MMFSAMLILAFGPLDWSFPWPLWALSVLPGVIEFFEALDRKLEVKKEARCN